ncbi:amino acid ABC transporter permease [Streptomyces sp. NPDC090032]|uniref:amino acid ABC transporter permease n=1 Tax=Streptomyces sp. NPDC090032 TaxID=3365925 RepID=UPI0038030A0E
MSWDEWDQLKADAAQRQTTHMQINSLQGEGGYAKPSGTAGGAGRLKHKSGPWTKAAGTADDLQTTTSTCRVELRSAHEGMGSGLEGLASLGSLKIVLNSWEERLQSVREECSSLEPKLRQVAVDLGEVDAEVGAMTKGVKVPGTRMGL